MRVFLGCGFFRKFGITSFFSLINDYMVKRKDLTPKDAATGPTFTGVFSVLGILLVLFTTAKFKYTKLIPHGVTTITYAGCMLATTFVHKNVSVSDKLSSSSTFTAAHIDFNGRSNIDCYRLLIVMALTV